MADPVFFAPSRQFLAGEIASLVGGELLDTSHASTLVTALGAAKDGGSGVLVFIDGRRNAGLMENLHAAAVLCQAELAPLAPPGVAVIATRRPVVAFARLAQIFYPAAARPMPVTGETGISPRAWISADARIEPGAIIEAGATVGPRAAIGSGAVLAPGATIGPDCQIGRDCYIGPSASVVAAFIGNRVILHPGVRIGQDGFRFIPGETGLEKMPQLGRVIIQDDVEIGANTAVDRGGIGDTIIGEGTKIDNLVQIGHNVQIGRHCAIAAHVGISGSVVIGDFVLIGGRVGIADHVAIGSGVQLAAGSGVMHNIPPGQKWAGTPAKPAADFFREVNALSKLAGSKRLKGTAR